MRDKYFLDSNIIVYSFDIKSLDKQLIAKNLISNAIKGQGCISYQVIQEFLNVASSKFKKPLSLQDCEVYLKNVLTPLCEVYPSIEFFSQALQIKKRWQYSWYDSLIITAALDANCSILYSEDMQHKQVINQLTIINPFFELC